MAPISLELILDFTIAEYCEEIKDILDTATFEQKRQLLDVLDVRGTLDVEDNERVVYVKCLLSLQQQLSLALTSPWRCCHKGTQYIVTARLVLPKYGGRKGLKGENKDMTHPKLMDSATDYTD